uniref:Uncharacterized protein n=1 Tax=Panagrolaimus sp. ES5 TaxID=591445 RepID=A0AC34F1W6_9BILA
MHNDDEITPTSGAEANEVEQNPKDVFLELIRQRFDGNAVQQCPCVIPSGSDKCIAYDPRYSAISVEEAVVAFSDLTADNFDTNPYRRDDYNCTTDQCIQCTALLFYRLKEINFIPRNYMSRFNFDIPQLQELRPQSCKRLWMTRRRHLLAPPLATPDYVRKLIEEGSRYVNDYSRFPSTDYSTKVTETLSLQNGPQYNSPSLSQSIGQQAPFVQQSFFQPVGQVGPSAPPSFSGFPGPVQFPPVQSFQAPFISPPSPSSFYYPYPSVTGGVGSGVGAGGAGTGAGALGAGAIGAGGLGIAAGAGGTRFPPGMLEKLVAEKAAFLSLFGKKRRKRNTHDVSGKNLIGWGSCTQRYRHVDVLHKQNGSWVPTTVVSGACCDCKIRAGTEVHQLVIGNTQREYRQVDSVIDRAYRATVDQNNPPKMDNIDDHPASATDPPSTQSGTTLFPPGEINIGR